MFGSSFVKSDNYLLSEVSLSSVPLFSSSKALFISSDFDIFRIKLVLFSTFVVSFLSLLDILYNTALSAIVF